MKTKTSLFGKTRPVDQGRLREEIAYLEARLDQIGYDGDCAYEKAMIRFFQEQVGARRARLAAMPPA